MNEISKIIIPGNTVPYDLRDDYARERINNSHLFIVSPLMTHIINIHTLLGRVVEPYEGLMLHILCTNNNNDSITPTFIRLAANESPIEIEYSNFIRRRPINGGIYSFILHYIPEEEATETPAHWNFYPIDDTLKSKGVEIIEYTTEADAAYAQVKKALSQNILPVVHYIDTNADNYEYWLPLYEYTTDKTGYIFSASTAYTSNEDISLSYIRINLYSTTWAIDNRGINKVDIPTIAQAKGLFYGTCQTSDATAAKTVTGVADWPDSFFAGQTILIKFQYGNNVKENLTLSINGSTAAPIVTYDGVSPAAIWAAGSILLFIYSGTDWRLVDGADGKSAYAYAQDGGYTGTEAEFAEKLAQEQLAGTTDELTPTQVYNAVSAGIPVKVQYTDSTYGLISFTAFTVSESQNVIASSMIAYYNGVYILCELVGYKSTDRWGFETTTLAQKVDIPEALPNPNTLTFTGAVTGSYDGSAPMSVEIPSGGSGGTEETVADVQLASGTIPAETASLTSIDTGVTLEMLKQYKRFAFKFKGASNIGLQNVYLWFAANSGAIARTDNVSGVAISYEWINTTASLLRICAQFSGNQSLISAIGTGYVFKTVPVSHGNGLCGTGMLGVLDLSTIAASSTLKIFLTYKATIDYNWELRGITA